jgi:diguanylate cyclase (GGDEF)-like protein
LLHWGANAAGILMVNDLSAIASGRAYAKLLVPDTAASRSDVVIHSPQRDGGDGVPYQVQYGLAPPGVRAGLWIEDTGRWFAGADGTPARAHGVVRVITDRHEREERLARRSRFDALTGELNRACLADVLHETLAETLRQRASCELLLIAIDALARINESYGFDIGDEAICAIAKRLRAKMRGGDHLGRFSGNRFAVILNNCVPDDLETAAQRLLAGVRDDLIRTSAGPVATTITIGGVTAPRLADNVPEMLSRAQEALDGAKARRRGSYQVYRLRAERETVRRENMRAADEIVAALNERRVELAFEPVVGTVTREPLFHECLLRMRRAGGELAKASEVIPLAERLGLVRLLDHRVMELLLAEMAAVPGLQASVNASPASTTDPDWWSVLCALLRAHDGVGERLIIEIPEKVAIHDLDEARAFVARAKNLGCRIAIDDFGSGHTPFRDLRNLGVDMVKIDGAFVQNLTRSEDDRTFVQTLIELGKRLGLKTVSKWVPDEGAARLLADWGCDGLQGALIGLAAIERPWGAVVPVDRRRQAR